MNNVEALDKEFGLVADLVKLTARDLPDHTTFILDGRRQSYAETVKLMARVAASLQRDGVKQREAISVCASTSIEYATLFLGALSIGVVTAPLAPSSTPEQLEGMVADSGAKLLFLPKYSPDLNPIEKAFAKFKHLLRKAAARTCETVLAAIGELLDTFTPQECANYLESSGYRT